MHAFLDSINLGISVFLHDFVNIAIKLLELAGVVVVMITAAKAIIGYFKKDPHIRLKLAQGIALGLEFKLGGEVLHTVIATELNELIILGAIILLRGLLTVLLHWEIKTEEERADRCVVPFDAPPSHPLETKGERKAAADKEKD